VDHPSVQSSDPAAVTLPFGRARIRIATAAVLALLLVVWAWPELQPGDRFPDSMEYLSWPEPVKTTGVGRLGPRMPGYPLLLRAFGDGVALVQLQSWLSLGVWSWLGWLLAGPAGMFLAGLASLSPEIRYWNFAVLTESPTLTAFAALIALAFQLGRRWSWTVFAVWSGVALLFGGLRSSNALVLPFLLVPFVRHAIDFGAAAAGRLSVGSDWRRFSAAGVVVVVVFIGAWVLSERSEAWRMNYEIALMWRIQPDAELRGYFVDRGMPWPGDHDSPEYAAWFDEHARRSYEAWVLGRARSWTDAWTWLRPDEQRAVIEQKYVAHRDGDPTQTIVRPIAVTSFALLAPPQPLFAALLLLPLVEWWRRRDVGTTSLLVAALVVGSYLQCFVTLHGSIIEQVRHTLLASVMYRVTFALGLCAIWQIVRAKSQ
jgi:hypothetical protein